MAYYDLRHTSFSKYSIYGVSETGEPVNRDNMPGLLCHNHESIDFPTPLNSHAGLKHATFNPGWSSKKSYNTFQEAVFVED